MLVNKFLLKSAELYPNKEALVCDSGRYTYKYIIDKVNNFAKLLISQGVKKRDKVILWLPNSLETVIGIFGSLQAGAVFIVFNHQVKPEKLKYIIEDSGASTLITDRNNFSQIGTSLDEFNTLKNYIIKGLQTDSDEIGLRKNILPFDNFSDFSNYPNNFPRLIDVDLASIIYTSGSTGRPKGAVFTHQNMVAAAISIIEYLENIPEDIIYNVLPLSFDYGLYQLIMAFKFGGTLVLEKAFTYPYYILKRLKQEKATGFPIVPVIANILLNLEKLPRYKLPNLRYITNTGQKIPVKTIKGLQKAWPHVQIYSMYGLTECKRVAYLPPDKLSKKPESVGQAMPNTEAFLVDEDGNKINQPNKEGELVVRSASIMLGYWKRKSATKEVVKPGEYEGDRWLYTGDLFKMDEEGDLYFCGRKDAIIKKLGEKVSPREIENVLYKLDDIAEAAVFGIPDKIAGQAIKAVVSLKKSSNLSPQDIIEHCSKYLEPYMIPKFIDIRSSLPINPNGKIDKKRLIAAEV